MVVSFGGVRKLTSVGTRDTQIKPPRVSTNLFNSIWESIFGSLASFLYPISGSLKRGYGIYQVDYLALSPSEITSPLPPPLTSLQDIDQPLATVELTAASGQFKENQPLIKLNGWRQGEGKG